MDYVRLIFRFRLKFKFALRRFNDLNRLARFIFVPFQPSRFGLNFRSRCQTVETLKINLQNVEC